MYKTTMKYLLLTAIFSTQLYLNAFAMDDDLQEINTITQKKTLLPILPIDEEIQEKGGEKALRNKQSEELQQNQTANNRNQKIGQNIVSTKKLEDRYGY